jgi:2-(1,2-epoxy-1,2-dihydrophenyl)acetyl-CoA isomerase
LEHQAIKAELKEGVEWITLTRPAKLNAFDDQMGDELLEALRQCESRSEVRCVVITGEGRAFSVGEDLSLNREAYEGGRPVRLGETVRKRYNPIVQRMRRMEKPIVGAINGVTAGAGLGLALACDLRAAGESATFHEAFIKVGLTPDSGTSFWLTRILGLTKAMEVGMLGDPIDARTALNLGLVNWVFPDSSLLEEVSKIAARLAAGPTRGLGLTKRALNRGVVVDLDSALEYEAYLQEIAGRTKDHTEGAKSFFEKRKPSFTGE